MKQPSVIAKNVVASTTLAIDSMYKQMKADGIDVVGFGAGEPDFHTPDNIKAAAIKAIENNMTTYTPASGTVDLKEAIVKRVKEDFDLDYKASQVVVASGAKHNVFIAISVLCDHGDEVILPAPYWVSYIEMIKIAGGVPVVLKTDEDTGFKITAQQLEAAITDKTKCIILNNPSNPTGMVYSKEELQAIADVCVKHGIYVIADEIYSCLLYDNLEFTSFASLGEEVKNLTILINGASKAYAMTGWRIGYAIANDEIAKVMSNYLSHSTGAPATFAQKGAAEAFAGPQDSREMMRQAFEERRNYLVERMNTIEGVSCIKPQGAFYVMMNIKKLIGKELHGVMINDADDFANVFLKKGLVATVPGTGFGAPEFVRWSYATSMETIKEGLDRLEKFLAE